MTHENEPQVMGSLLANRQPKPGSVATSKPSKAFCEPAAFAKAMLTLTAAKRTAQFTTQELQVWHSILGTFRSETINRAVLYVIASEQRFPELSDLLQQCRRIEKRQAPYSPHDSGKPERPLTEPELVDIAQRIGLEV